MLNVVAPGKTVYNGGFYGGLAAQHATQLAEITNIVNASGADIVYLSSGGNDMLAGSLGGGWVRGNNNAPLYASIQNNVQIVVDHILGIRPDIQIVIAGYDYLNVWDYGNDGLLLAANLGIGKTGNIFFDLPQNQELNDGFKAAEAGKISIANNSRRVHHVSNFGLTNTVFGYNGYFGNWPAVGSYPPEAYAALPSPTSRLNDPIHLNTSGYELLTLNVYNQFLSTAFQPANLTTSATTLSFGTLRVGTSTSLGVTASNNGPNFTKVQNLFFPAATGAFAGGGLSFNPLFQDPLLGSDTATVSYQFVPSNRGAFNQNHSITSDSGSRVLNLWYRRRAGFRQRFDLELRLDQRGEPSEPGVCRYQLHDRRRPGGPDEFDPTFVRDCGGRGGPFHAARLYARHGAFVSGVGRFVCRFRWRCGTGS